MNDYSSVRVLQEKIMYFLPLLRSYIIQLHVEINLVDQSHWAWGPRAWSTWSSDCGFGPCLPKTSGFNP